MRKDLHGLAISTASDEASAAFERTVMAYLKYRADTPEHLERALAADPDFALANCLQGYFAMTSFKQANVAMAQQAARKARARAAKATARERAHVDALDAWIAGDLDRTLSIWKQILGEHPRDVLAFRLAHFVNFWLGRPQAMRASAEGVRPHWGRELPGYGTLMSCLCFAREECGDYASAEPAGWQALEIDRADFWGVHALAHVMEMQGRQDDGIALIEDSEPHWPGGNNLQHHLAWHRALFHYERREFDTVLELYDQKFRNLASPLAVAVPDLYIDIQNAASMLFRLERQGVDVGDRWNELADKAEQRIGDCLSAFTLPHWMMALATTGRGEAADRMLAAMRAFGARSGTVAEVVRDVALPVSEAVLLNRRGEYARATALMRRALVGMSALGGSHAQQDVLLQLYADAALKANRPDDLEAALARAGMGRKPPAERIGYAEAARLAAH
jgi:tetratricopeptide (TPR) repeat protein